MPFALTWLMSCKICRLVMLAVALVAAFYFFMLHERHVGAAKVVAQVQAATAAESARRVQALQAAQEQAKQAEAQISVLKDHINELTAASARHSVAHDREPCLDRNAVDRLRAIGRRPPGH